jgi:EAL and modified HD-GYP domain-containing signal transduction protein
MRPEVSLDELEDVVGSDPTLSFRVLAYANSAHAAQRRKIDSLRAALVLFGQDDIRRAARLVVLSGLCSDMPEHEVTQSVVRSRLCEELAGIVGEANLSGRYALCGLLSNLDVMLGQAMGDVVQRLPLTEDMAAALVSRRGVLGATLALAVSYENGEWDKVRGYASDLGVPLLALPLLYQHAVQSVAKLMPRSATPIRRAPRADFSSMQKE